VTNKIVSIRVNYGAVSKYTITLVEVVSLSGTII